MPERSYSGGCHCKAVRYEVAADLGRVISCNCSFCSARGSLLTFVPASQFKLLSGEDALTDYQFNKKHIHHLFCRMCGIESFARGTDKNGADSYAVNVRCLDDVDISALRPVPFDGRSL
ncbi:MAG: GFA family protein [Alphaproteobacteria bacterium]